MKKYLLFLFLIAFAFAEDIPEISWEQVPDFTKKGAVVLDVRTQEEVLEGAVLNALFIPLQELEMRISELPKDKTILVYCRSGRRSAKATAFLIHKGYKAYNIQGGFLAVPPKKIIPHS